MTHILTINHDHFVIDDDQVARLREDVEAAVRAGGQMISVRGQWEGTEVLISSGSHVRIDLVTAVADELEGDTEFVDFGEYRLA